MPTLYSLLLILFVGGLITRNVYEILKKSGRVDAANKKLFALIFSTMCLLWTSWFTMCWFDPNRMDLSSVVRGGGLCAVIIGWTLAFWALIQLRGLENINHLVTTGVFYRLRHPMYTGFILWILGWALFLEALTSLVAGLLGILSILYWRNLEDHALESRYGEIYRRYRERTWF